MRFIISTVTSAIFFAFSAQAEPPKEYGANELPEACLGQLSDALAWRACFAAAPDDHPVRLLAAMNIGTFAFVQHDYESAAHWYALSQPENMTTVSDIVLHVHRALSFSRSGKTELARADTRRALTLLKQDKFDDDTGQKLDRPTEYYVLAILIGLLKEEKHADLDGVVERFMRLVPANEMEIAQKIGVLDELGRSEEALPFSAKLVEINPDHSGMLNNHCYILFNAGKAAEALAFCERALALDRHAIFLHSYASALGALNRCEEAEAALNEARSMEPSAKYLNDGIKGCAAD